MKWRRKLALRAAASIAIVIFAVIVASIWHDSDGDTHIVAVKNMPQHYKSDSTESGALQSETATLLDHASQQNDEHEMLNAVNLDDEATTRSWVIQETEREVRRDYDLLIEQLDLSPRVKEELYEFLIADLVARTKTQYSDGIGASQSEREQLVGQLLGRDKLEEFLKLESNLAEFKELKAVQAMLRSKNVPLTESQSNRLLQIMIDVRKQIDLTRPSDIEPGTIEALEHTLQRLDEYDRLVTELAPSALSAVQVQHMFDRNMRYSYRRAETLAWHQKQEANNTDGEVALGYFPKKD